MSDLSCEIIMNGFIDNQFKFEDLDKEIKKIIIHLDNVTYINSFGIKMWVQWLQRVKKDAALILYGVRPTLISSVNTVSGFILSNTTIQSVYAPYISEDGEESSEILLELGQNYFLHRELVLPEVKDSQGNKMEPDFTQKSFFKFLRS